MKTLVVFYTRTGTSWKVAQEIAKLINADLEELVDLDNRKGIIGFIKSGRDAIMKKRARLQQTRKDPAAYDLVILGTPIWASNLSTPLRTYVDDNKKLLELTALFCTAGGNSKRYADKCLDELEQLTGHKPVAFLGLDKNDMKQGFENKVAAFTSFLQNPQQSN